MVNMVRCLQPPPTPRCAPMPLAVDSEPPNQRTKRVRSSNRAAIRILKGWEWAERRGIWALCLAFTSEASQRPPLAAFIFIFIFVFHLTRIVITSTRV